MGQKLVLFLHPISYPRSRCSCSSFWITFTTKRLFAQKHLSSSINFRCSCTLFSIRDLAVAIARTVLTTPLFLRKANRNVLIFSSRCPSVSGFLADDKSIAFDFKFLRYLSRNVLTVLLFKCGCEFSNFYRRTWSVSCSILPYLKRIFVCKPFILSYIVMLFAQRPWTASNSMFHRMFSF